MTSSLDDDVIIIYHFLAFFETRLFQITSGKKICRKYILIQICVFDVAFAIQRDLMLSIRHRTNFEAGC